MQNAFTDGFRQYLSRHHREIARDPHALALIQPLYGLADTATYESWKLSNDLRYYDTSFSPPRRLPCACRNWP